MKAWGIMLWAFSIATYLRLPDQLCFEFAAGLPAFDQM